MGMSDEDFVKKHKDEERQHFIRTGIHLVCSECATARLL